MLEVELKFRNADRTATVATLLDWGATLEQDRTDVDLYFQAPDRDLKETGEAFRLRRVGPKNYLTYKGPKRDAETKTRPEIEVALADGDATAADAERMLLALGYTPVTTVRKKRRVYAFTRDGFDVEACFDTLDGVGDFVELEIIAEEAQYEAAKAAVLAAAADLGLTEKETRSYLGLVIAAQAAKRKAAEGTEWHMLPPIATTIAEVRRAVAAARAQGKTIGFVPTMGALHEGHAALVRAARAASGFVVVSIFVNPTQFGPKEDFAKYPRTLEADQKLCGDAGANLIFAPGVEEMYPENSLTFVDVEKLGDALCGASRPGHFRGVCTVVLKLFNIVLPDAAHFGAKDYQQARIITQMVRDLNVPVAVRVEPTVREPDGLALSSRNRYLSAAERAVAPRIRQALQATRKRALAGEIDAARLESALAAELSAIPGARVDYARVVDAETLQPLARLDRPAVAAAAVFLGSTRLIDNLRLD